MSTGKTVETTASNCIFGTFFGAGYGGTAFTRVNTYNKYGTLTYAWNGKTEDVYLVPQFTNIDGDGNSVSGTHHRGTFVTNQGISANYEYENFEGSNINTVAYLFVNYASLSVAQCNNVTSTLTGCTIERNFYGGGSLGSVAGNIESVLENCTVGDSVFGGGYSASIPTVNVFPDGSAGLFQTIPVYNPTTGVFEKGVFPSATEYKWSDQHGTSESSTLTDADGGHWIYAPATKLTDLGLVKGNATLTLKGTTSVNGCVFGGGDLSGVRGSTTVTLQENTHINGDVFGGGNRGEVNGNTSVTIQ